MWTIHIAHHSPVLHGDLKRLALAPKRVLCGGGERYQRVSFTSAFFSWCSVGQLVCVGAFFFCAGASSYGTPGIPAQGQRSEMEEKVASGCGGHVEVRWPEVKEKWP